MSTIVSGSGGVTFSTWTTGTRPSTPSDGQTGFNTDTNLLETWDGSSWVGGLPNQSGNAGKFLTTDGSNASWSDLPPTITNVAPSSFDGNAGQSFSVSGFNFAVGCSTVFVAYNGVTTYATTTTRVNASSLTVVNSSDMPVSNETYTLKVINPDGSFAVYSGIDAGAVPSWTTASGSLGTWDEQSSVSTSVTATDPDGGAITYSSGDIGSGSLTWLSLNPSTGAITGTSPDVASNTSYSFSVTATDNASNASARSFSITINAVTAPTTVDVLVAAGGGAGGAFIGGGGGAGGLCIQTGRSVTSGVAYTVTIGAGGTKVSGDVGGTGSNSVFNTITALGGGGGGSGSSQAANGGSGGGAPYANNSGFGSATQGSSGGATGYGYAGGPTGSNGTSNNYPTGGGGGSGGTGGTGSSTSRLGGNGGSGTTNSFSGASVTYCGGGGGAYGNDFSAGTAGTGSAGGGNGGYYGAGGSPGAATAATANSGSGGGGGGGGGTDGGNGGSGVVIVRYSDIYSAAASTTGSPTVTVTGGYRIYKWTSSGSITF